MGITDWDKEKMENDREYACQLFCACSEIAPWNTVRPCGLAAVDLIRDLSHIGLGERDHPILWVGDGPHTQHDAIVVKACITCTVLVW